MGPHAERPLEIVTNDKMRSTVGDRSCSATTPPTTPQFDSLFLEHWPKIYRVLLRLVGNHADAEDLALETFVRLYRRPPSSPREHNLGGWLYRVATNLGLNALRARKRRERHELEAGYLEIESNPATDALDAAAAEEEARRVRRVLSSMEPRQAELLMLRHSGMAYKELAATIGVSVNSIGTLLVRAEREFEKRYREKGE